MSQKAWQHARAGDSPGSVGLVWPRTRPRGTRSAARARCGRGGRKDLEIKSIKSI